ncbi:MAG: PAS domain S-box protein [Deltaproteobacteria bacterium]|nr:PAS domain S-box protein [Deltaproteobacteria bacterium]
MPLSLASVAEHFELTPDGMLVVDRASTIRDANQPAADMFMRTKAELRGSSFERHFPAQVEGEVERSIRDGLPRALNKGRAISGRRADGSDFLASVSLRPLALDGETMVLASIRDVSESVRIAGERERLRERLETLVELARVGTWEVDLATGASRYSRELLELLGRDRAGSEEELFLTSVHPDDLGQLQSASKAAAQEAKPYRLELRVRHRDGSWRWFETKAFVERGRSGRPAVIRGLALDITDRKALDEAIRRSEANLRLLVESHPDAIFISKHGTIVECNRRGAALLGRSDPRELVGVSALDLVHPDERERVARAVNDPKPGDWRLLRADGSVATVETQTVEIMRDGRPHLVTIARDVTEARLEAQHRRASDRMASLGLMAAGIAHDINNPLAVALLNLQAASDALTAGHGAAALACVTEASDAARQVAAIVSDLKVFSRDAPAVDEAVSVARVAESAVRLASPELRHKARVSIDIEEDLAIWGSEHRLGQVLLNLLVNAAQAIDPGAFDKNHVRIEGRTQAEQAEILVSDTGHGIPDAVRERLFTPFATARSDAGGTGLGLAICQRIVEEMGGQISFESSLGHGTTFRLTLRRAMGATREVSSTRPALQGRARVLIIDDEVGLTRALRRVLEADYEVETASSAEDAMAILASDRDYDVILCDVSMPTVTGIELFEQAAALDPELGSRVVFMTGGPTSQDVHDFLATKMKGRVLAKPFDLQAVRRMIVRRARRASSMKPVV